MVIFFFALRRKEALTGPPFAWRVVGVRVMLETVTFFLASKPWAGALPAVSARVATNVAARSIRWIIEGLSSLEWQQRRGAEARGTDSEQSDCWGRSEKSSLRHPWNVRR